MFKINFEKIGMLLVLTPLTAFIVDTLTLFLGGQITLLNPILTYLIILGSVFKLGGEKKDICHYIFFSSIFLVSATLIYDYGTDGQWYNAKIVQLLLNGWNPIYNPFGLPDALYINAENEVFWAAHYAKGMEMVGSTFAVLTDNLETSKATNFYFVIGSLMLVLSWLKQYFAGWKLALLSIVVTFNPIVVNQIFTGYIDWTAYTLLLITIYSLFRLLNGQKQFATLYFPMLFFVLSIKFNIAFWIVVFTFLFFCLFVIYKKCKFPKKLFIGSVCTLILGLFVGGFNPYVTNVEKYGNPFYPLIGEEKIEIMDSNELELIKGKSRFEQVNLSLLSNPYNKSEQKDLQVLSLKKENVISSILVDTRIGGFGIFFFEACMILLISFLLSKRRKVKIYLAIFNIALYLSLFILPSGWWARYVSYFYLLPVIMLLYSLRTLALHGIYKKLMCYVASFLLLMDIAVSFGGACLMSIVERSQVNYMLKLLTNNSENVISTGNTLFADKARKAGVKIVKSHKDMSCVDLLGKDVWVKRDAFENSKKIKKPLLLAKVPMFDLKYRENIFQ